MGLALTPSSFKSLHWSTNLNQEKFTIILLILLFPKFPAMPSFVFPAAGAKKNPRPYIWSSVPPISQHRHP